MLNKNNILRRPVFIFLRTLHQFLVPEKGKCHVVLMKIVYIVKRIIYWVVTDG